jgi:cytosine deaminase
LADAEQAGALVLWLANQAARDGSFGIAGAMFDNASGRVLQMIPNRVMERLRPEVATTDGETFTHDPTAHGERQLVSWYYANRGALALPEASQLTVVTSLDPCVMCTGALVTAGFNVGVVAPDTFSGINYTQTGEFADLPTNVRAAVLRTFGYYAVAGGRGYQGAATVPFAATQLSQDTFNGCEDTYQISATEVRQSRKDSGTDPAALKDPTTTTGGRAVLTAYRKMYPQAFELRLPSADKPDAALRQVLTQVRDGTPGATNAVAFVDPFGNVVLVMADTAQVSPVATAFMNVAQTYSTTRFELMNDRDTNGVAKATLTSPKYGTFVFLNAPDPGTAGSLLDLGGYGSTVESAPPKPGNFQYFDPPLTGTMAALEREIAALPPLYSQLIKISPQQVTGG